MAATVRPARGSIDRRSFLKSSVASSAAAAMLVRNVPARVSDPMPEKPDLRVGLIGCGGRGRGSLRDILEAAPNIRVTALADVFTDRVEAAREGLREMGQTVPESRCFVGLDAYQRVIESGVDVVSLATPPYYRPEHFEAVVEAGKHVFVEKPVGVDAAGVRRFLKAGEKAESKGLTVVAGTQRRHQNEYLAAYERIAGGEIGDIVAARCAWMQGMLWYREKEPEWSESDWMLRDWVNWCWLSGDHIVEQHVHNIDVVQWFTGKLAHRAVGNGGRHRRVTGDQFDFFDVDFELEGGVHALSRCRQINGCANDVSEALVGTLGWSDCRSTIWDHSGRVLWRYEGPKVSPYVQEQANLVRAVRNGKPLNESRSVAEATLTAIMGRVSAYTGQEVTREAAAAMTEVLGPDLSHGKVPVPGAPAGGPRPV